MQIAIIGAGFSGLALCYYLTKLSKEGIKVKVTVFDSFNTNECASSISSGLLHAFGGAHCKKTWAANECMQKTNELLNQAENALNKTIANRSGILRPALTIKQLEDFQNTSSLYSDTLWWDQKKCAQELPYLHSLGALFISSGISVNAIDYLEGLRICCKNNGAFFEAKTILDTKEELKEFDVIVACSGAYTLKLPAFKHLPLHFVKGQLIELAWPKDLPPLPFSIVSNGYITMNALNTSCVVGATYERNFLNAQAEHFFAENELRPKAEALIPALKDAPLLSYKAGIRVFSPDNLTPIIGKVNGSTENSLWTFTALGSKGLLYHAYFAELAAQAILEDKPEILPLKVRCRL